MSENIFIAKNKDLYYDALARSQDGWHECTEDVIPDAALYVTPSGKSKACCLRQGRVKSYLEAAKAVDVHAIFYIALAGDMSPRELSSLKW